MLKQVRIDRKDLDPIVGQVIRGGFVAAAWQQLRYCQMIRIGKIICDPVEVSADEGLCLIRNRSKDKRRDWAKLIDSSGFYELSKGRGDLFLLQDGKRHAIERVDGDRFSRPVDAEYGSPIVDKQGRLFGIVAGGDWQSLIVSRVDDALIGGLTHA